MKPIEDVNHLFIVDKRGDVFIRCVRGAYIKGYEFDRNEKIHFHWSKEHDAFECQRSNRYERRVRGLYLTIEEMQALMKDSFSFIKYRNDWITWLQSYSS